MARKTKTKAAAAGGQTPAAGGGQRYGGSFTHSAVAAVTPYALMGLVLPFVGVLAVAARIWIAGRPVPMALTSVFITAGGAGLAVFAWHVFQPRGLSMRVHAAVTLGAASLWLLLAVIFGPREWVVASYVMGGLVAVLTWAVRRLARSQGQEGAHEDQDGGAAMAEAVGLAKAKFGKPRVDEETGAVRARVQLPPGELTVGTNLATPETRARIASYHGLASGQVRVEELDPPRADVAEVVLAVVDPFQAKVYWQGPHLPGESIAAEIQYATRETRKRAGLYLPGDPSVERNASHFLVMGVSGAGKSKAWQAIYGTAMNRRECSVLGGDPAKGVATLGPLAPGLEWLADSPAGCKSMMKSLPDVIRERTEYLTSIGLDEWAPGCGINYMVWHLEEASELAQSPKLVLITERARAAGISLVISLQRASHDRMDTSVRYNLGNAMCFGVREKQDADFALTEATIGGGAEPWAWRDKYPGRHYLEANGVPDRYWPEVVKADWLDMDALREAIRDGQRYRTPLDEITAKALGADYAAYRQDVEAGRTKWQAVEARLLAAGGVILGQGWTPPAPRTEAAPAAVAATVPDPEELDQVDEELAAGQDEAEEAPIMPEVRYDPTEEIPETIPPGPHQDVVAGETVETVDVMDEDDQSPRPVPRVTPPAGLDSDAEDVALEFPRPAPAVQLSKTEAEDALWRFLVGLAEAGRTHVDFAEVVEERVRIGRSASWLNTTMRGWVSSGRLPEQDRHGSYTLPRPARV